MTGWVKSLLADASGAPDDGRVMAILAILVALCLAVYSVVWQHRAFDMQQYGIGIGALFGGLGAMLKLRGGN
ncbi:MAG: hypothetical protein M0T84_00370 [Betaproteobacteria bacterium]|nr:hypothetical protein [Betaproteobacteria bacterium]